MTHSKIHPDLPVGYGTNGKRSFGLCPICHHHGTDCRCSLATYRGWYQNNENARRMIQERVAGGWTWPSRLIEVDDDAPVREGTGTASGLWVQAWIKAEEWED